MKFIKLVTRGVCDEKQMHPTHLRRQKKVGTAENNYVLLESIS
jgi:hypothetical protein